MFSESPGAARDSAAVIIKTAGIIRRPFPPFLSGWESSEKVDSHTNMLLQDCWTFQAAERKLQCSLSNTLLSFRPFAPQLRLHRVFLKQRCTPLSLCLPP